MTQPVDLADLELWARREMAVGMCAVEAHLIWHGDAHEFDDCPMRAQYLAEAARAYDREHGAWRDVLPAQYLADAFADVACSAPATPPPAVSPASIIKLVESACAALPPAEELPAEIRVGPDALDALREVSSPPPPWLGGQRGLPGLPVHLDPALPSGGWEVRSATGVVLSSGTIAGR